MTAFAGFLVETLGASVILVSVGVAGTKLVVNNLLRRDIELHKMRLKEASDQALARLREELERIESSKPQAPSTPPVIQPRNKRQKVTRQLFELFDEATLSIVRFVLEFRAEKLEAADEAGRSAVEKASRLSNFVRLNRSHFPKAVAGSIEAAALPFSELAWRSYRTFKDPALSEKETAQEIQALNTQALALGRQIEAVKGELARLLESEGQPDVKGSP